MTPAAALKRLGLAKGADVTAIRKAYAALYKAMDPDADPEGYARLRAARDIALRAAKLAAAPPPPPVEEPEVAAAPAVDTPAAPWLYAAPTLALPEAGEVPLLVAGNVQHPDVAVPPPQPIHAPATPAAALRALAGPPLLDSAEPVRADVGYLARPDVDLARLLHDPEADLAPLDDTGEAFARRCLAALLAEAATANLTRHGQIEDWLADLLAETWPRSAPLLRPTAEAFGWENERGQINERPSIAWLNARLRGLRFQDKVADPAHPLHKAWAELTRPGSATMIDKLRVKRADINQLLEGVRKHFPELEHHFPRERVVSWGDGAARRGSGFGVFRLFGTGITFNAGYAISVVVALQILAAIGRMVTPDPTPQTVFNPPLAYQSASDPHYIAVRTAAIAEVFGKDKTIDWLRDNDPRLAGDFEKSIMSTRRDGQSDQAAIAASIELVRRRALFNSMVADDTTLRLMSRLRLAQIDFARKQGDEACNRFLRAGELTGLSMPEALRAQEREVAVHFVTAARTRRALPAGEQKATIPGPMIDQIIRSTGLSDARVRAALHDEATPSERCAVIRALLAAALEKQGSAAADILRLI